VTSLVYNPSGATLASGSEDGTIRLWDSQRPEKDPIMLRDQGVPIRALAYSPDGETLASGDAKGTVVFWLPDTAVLARRVCGQVRRNLSLEEWTRFVGAGIPYEATCPSLPMAPTLEIETGVASQDLASPIQLFPSEGTILYQHQRMTTLRWSRVPAATS
jgi:WD40 repeat protein